MVAAIALAAAALIAFSAAPTASAAPRAFAQVNGGFESRFDWGGLFNWWNDQWSKPVIDSIDPREGEVGDEVTITGSRFSDDSVLRFGRDTIRDTNVSDDGRTITFTIPDVSDGRYTVRVQDGYRTSNVKHFEVIGNDDADPEEDILSIEAIDGPSSLGIGVEGTWTVDAEFAGEGNLRYSVRWGDEEPSLMRLMNTDERIQTSATFTHTYDEAGTYTPEFTVTDENGNSVTKQGETVVVSDASVPYIENISPARATAQGTVTLTGQGFSGESTVKIGNTTVEDVTVHSDTELTFVVPSLTPKLYTVTVTDEDGTSNEVELTIAPKNGKVSVSGIDAPTRLVAGEEGTWTIDANSTLSGNLRYSVDWGDSALQARRSLSADVASQTSATFHYAYETPGTYKPKFTVTDEAGNSTSVSAVVRVLVQ